MRYEPALGRAHFAYSISASFPMRWNISRTYKDAVFAIADMVVRGRPPSERRCPACPAALDAPAHPNGFLARLRAAGEPWPLPGPLPSTSAGPCSAWKR